MKSIICEVFDRGSGDSSQQVAEHVNNLLGMFSGLGGHYGNRRKRDRVSPESESCRGG